MPSANVQVSFDADTSALQAAVEQLQPALAGLQVPVTAFQTAVTSAFGDTTAVSGWSDAVGASARSAASAVGDAGQIMQAAFTAHLDPVGASAARLFTVMTSGSQSFGQAFARMGEQMLSRFIGSVAQMAERWAAKELTQTAASTAGAAARTAVQVSADAAGMAASGAQALADIGNSAVRAAAGAYAAVASTPVVGPVLAPAAAATALAAVLEFGGQVFSAAGGWGQVPYDGALASLHKDEMVLPASLATPLRSALSGDGGGSGGSAGATHHHWNIQALDAASFARMARANPDAITGALTAAAQRLSLPGGSFNGGRGPR